MTPSIDSEIRVRLAGVLGAVFGVAVDAEKIHLPARAADASYRPPQGANPEAALAADFGSLWGAPLVASVRAVNGWLLFTFTPALMNALVAQVNAALPLPSQDGGDLAVNRMLALARHGGDGCPDLVPLRRALLYAVAAYRSTAARNTALRAANTLFHAFPPRERAALLSRCGALGGALARLLSAGRR